MFRPIAGLLVVLVTLTSGFALQGCGGGGGASSVATVTGVFVTGRTAQVTLQTGAFPTGPSPAPVPDSPTAQVAGTTATIGITTTNPVDYICIGIRGSGSFELVYVAAASRQTGGATHYLMNATLSGFDPNQPQIADLCTQTGTVVSQTGSVTLVRGH